MFHNIRLSCKTQVRLVCGFIQLVEGKKGLGDGGSGGDLEHRENGNGGGYCGSGEAEFILLRAYPGISLTSVQGSSRL